MQLFISQYIDSILFILFICCFLFARGSNITTSTTGNDDITTTEIDIYLEDNQELLDAYYDKNFGKPCGPLTSKLSEEETCYSYDLTFTSTNRNVEMICPNSSESGTVLEKRCRPSYNAYNQVPLYECGYGHWTPQYSSCVPYCSVPTKNNEYPWMVAIYDSNDDLVCSGTIITQYHVVTTASCFETTIDEDGYKLLQQEDYLIIAGKHYTNIHKRGGSFQKRKIKNWALENLDRKVVGADIALLVVDREFSFLENDDVRPVCVDWNGLYEDVDFKDGNEGNSVGWEYDKDQLVPCKFGNRSNVQYWHRNTCRKNLEIIGKGDVYISTVWVCGEYINASESDCGKDLGSGLFFNPNGDRLFLRGILRSRDEPGSNFLFYSKISTYYDWLLGEMQKLFRFVPIFKIFEHDDTGCMLPENVEYGKFALSSGNNYFEGKWVPPTTTLLLSCAGTTNASLLSFTCSKNGWTPSIDGVSCRAPGTCPPIPTTTSERVICKLDGVTVSCKNPPNNATALVRCQPFYTYSGDRPIYKCRDGEWDQPFTPCTLECGIKRVSVTELIIGGEQALEHEYPWVVAVYNSTDDQICSGTIISRKFVVSAAHCFATRDGDLKDKDGFTIIAGKYYRDMGIEEPSAQKRKVKSLNIHPDYRAKLHKYRDDIALIEVGEDFVASLEVEPICIDWDNVYDDFDLADGNLGVVTGWGFTTIGSSPSPTLKKLVVPFRDKRVCLENLPMEFSQQFVVNDKICAGYKDNSTNVCQGDSGGGLYFKSDEKRYFIRGIVSITVRSEVGCDPNRFALYTKVSTYLRWLESMTRRVY